MNIGSAIKNARVVKGKSQGELAKESGISQTALSQIENNISRPNKTTLKKVALALDIPEQLFYLLALEESDIPEEKKQLYDTIYPSIRNMVEKLIS